MLLTYNFYIKNKSAVSRLSLIDANMKTICNIAINQFAQIEIIYYTVNINIFIETKGCPVSGNLNDTHLRIIA